MNEIRVLLLIPQGSRDVKAQQANGSPCHSSDGILLISAVPSWKPLTIISATFCPLATPTIAYDMLCRLPIAYDMFCQPHLFLESVSFCPGMFSSHVCREES